MDSTIRNDTPKIGVMWNSIQQWPEVVAAQIVTGGSNYVLTVRARDLDHGSDFVINRLRRASGVMSINSSIVLATLKRDDSILDLVEPSTAG